MQKTLREKCKNKRRVEASMAEAFITEEAANFVIAHYEAKGMVQSWKASYEGNYPVGEKGVDVPRWVCSESKEGSEP